MVKPVYVYGSPGSGKTRNAKTLAEMFNLTHIVDEWRWPTSELIQQDTLYLGNMKMDKKYFPGEVHALTDLLDKVNEWNRGKK